MNPHFDRLTYFFKIFVLSFAVISANACRETDEPYSEYAKLVDIALIMPQDGNTNIRNFAVWQNEDSSPAILSAENLTLNPAEFKDGDRVLLSYKYLDASNRAYTSGKISVLGISKINNDLLRVDEIENHSNWNATPISLITIWRNDRYINIFSRLPYSTSSRHFMLMVDKPTLDNDYPNLYLIHDTNGAPEKFTRRNYASFDISALWDNESCEGVTIHIATENQSSQTFIFSKR